jgi:hypothetical protein
MSVGNRCRRHGAGPVRKINGHKDVPLAPLAIPGNLSSMLNRGSAHSGEGHPKHENQYCGRYGC